MRVVTQTELKRLSKPELMVLQKMIAADLLRLPDGSAELWIAHANLAAIRYTLAPKLSFSPSYGPTRPGLSRQPWIRLNDNSRRRVKNDDG